MDRAQSGCRLNLVPSAPHRCGLGPTLVKPEEHSQVRNWDQGAFLGWHPGGGGVGWPAGTCWAETKCQAQLWPLWPATLMCSGCLGRVPQMRTSDHALTHPPHGSVRVEPQHALWCNRCPTLVYSVSDWQLPLPSPPSSCLFMTLTYGTSTGGSEEAAN